jgi:sarcosine oxidase subunit gamma
MAEAAKAIELQAPIARLVFQGGAAARNAAGEAFGVQFPEAACRANARGERAVLWLGPDEHLLLAPDGTQQGVIAELETALAGIAHSLVDVSHRQVAIMVAGRAASEILNSGCPLDLDAAAFPVGTCTRTLFGKAEALLWRRSAEEYHLEVGRSLADYVLGCLREAQ